LYDEGKRWVETVAVLKVQIIDSIGDVFLSSACISYCGPFTGVFRNEMIFNWVKLVQEKEIPLGENFNLARY